MMPDYPAESTLDFHFTTRDFDTGAPQTLGGAPVISAYEDNSVTQITAGITLTADFDGVTGLNHVRVVATAANGYDSGSSYSLVITTGTVDGVSVVGEVVAQFSLERSPALRPTTAGRTLDVAATGEAGIDLGNVTGVLGQANVGWVDANSRVDVGSWLGTAVTTSATTNKPQVDVDSIDDDATAADNAESFFDGTGYAGTGNTIPTVTTLTGHTAQTGDNFARLGAPAGASVSADIAAIEAQTDDIGVAGAGLTAIPWNAAWDAQVESEVVDALVAQGLDHLVNAAVVGTDVADNSIVAKLAAAGATADWDTFDNQTDSLEALQADHVALQADTDDIQTRLPATLSSGRMRSDMEAVSALVAAADNLEGLMDQGVVMVQVMGTATTTSIPIDGFTSTRDDQFNGRLLTVLDGSFEQTDITDYVDSTTTLTVTALTAAPADNAWLIIH